MASVRGWPRPTPGVFATAGTTRGQNRLIYWPRQAILRSGRRPLGEYRLHPYLDPIITITGVYALAATLAQAGGRDPDKPRGMNKVTPTV